MDYGSKILRDVKEAANHQEELKVELMGYKSRLALEKQNLDLIRRDIELARAHTAKMNENLDSNAEQQEFLKQTRDDYNKSNLCRFYFKNYISEMEPTNETKVQTFNEVSRNYTNLVEKYEQRPEYRQVIEADHTGRQLAQCIDEKRDELMKLETEREF